MMPSTSTLPLRSAFCAWMKVTSGRTAGTAASTSPVKGHVTLLMVGVHAREFRAAIAAEDREGQAGRTRLIGIGHAGMAVFLDLDAARKAVLDRVAHAAQQADAGIADIGEDHLLRHAHADHLVVDQVGRHADQRQVAKTLADRLMRRGRRDQMREALEGGGVAVLQVFRHRLWQAA